MASLSSRDQVYGSGSSTRARIQLTCETLCNARTGGNVPRSERRQGCPRARADGNGKDARVHPTSDVPAARGQSQHDERSVRYAPPTCLLQPGDGKGAGQKTGGETASGCGAAHAGTCTAGEHGVAHGFWQGGCWSTGGIWWRTTRKAPSCSEDQSTCRRWNARTSA